MVSDDDFKVTLARRSVEVLCPDKEGGNGVHLPPGYDDTWMDEAVHATPGLADIEGPTIQSAYVFHWDADPHQLSNGQIKFRSVRILRGLY